MHSMSFHFGVTETILFEKWQTTNWQEILGSSIGVILLGTVYEALKSYRDYLYKMTSNNCQHKVSSKKESLLSIVHAVQTILHAIQAILGYFLMFIFMTYNVYLCIAVIIGMSVGYFIFAWQKTGNNNNECCA
ncbi:high affinity copper uptake protein 1-like [Leptopilina boulardi]|uniref:high affinity copper uptake protein 1-like n=1 Tax=Leptopilina boulardi TaxID=63433 RepID=UPI0021F56853|nr:high affinity copper uptake protein 1-like [Leptopilina boulardi]